MEENTYELDSAIIEYLSETFDAEEILIIQSIFKAMDMINDSDYYNYHIRLPELELELIDIISNANEELDTIRNKFISKIKNYILDSIEEGFGIKLNRQHEKCTIFSCVFNIVITLNTLVHLDPYLADEITDILESDEDNELILSLVINKITGYNQLELYEIIEEISLDDINKLNHYLNNNLYSNITENTYTLLLSILNKYKYLYGTNNVNIFNLQFVKDILSGKITNVDNDVNELIITYLNKLDMLDDDYILTIITIIEFNIASRIDVNDILDNIPIESIDLLSSLNTLELDDVLNRVRKYFEKQIKK